MEVVRRTGARIPWDNEWDSSAVFSAGSPTGSTMFFFKVIVLLLLVVVVAALVAGFRSRDKD